MRMKELRIKDHGNIYCVQAEEDSSLLDVFVRTAFGCRQCAGDRERAVNAG